MACSQKKNINYDVEKRGVQTAAEVKRKVAYRRKNELDNSFHIQDGKTP